MNYFVTGTDTGVGKTYVTSLLTRALRRAGLDTVALKPICCGPRDDVEVLCAASEDEIAPDACNPIWLRNPVAPVVAARQEQRELDWESLAPWFRRHRNRRRSLLVEGVGGWLVPLSTRTTVADLAKLFGLPILVVVSNRLGCLNHTLLTVESIRARGLSCNGLVLNTLPGPRTGATDSNRQALEEICDVPILFDIRPGQEAIELAVA